MSSNEPAAPSPATDQKGAKKPMDLFKLCSALYAGYAIALVMECWKWTVLPGAIVPMSVLALAYAYRNEAQGTPYESHLHWVIRTFWIGCGVFLPIMTVVGSLAVVSQIDWGALQNAVFQGRSDSVQDIMNIVIDKNYKMMFLTSLATMVPFGLWLLWRCWQGYEKLKDHKPMENVERWY